MNLEWKGGGFLSSWPSVRLKLHRSGKKLKNTRKRFFITKKGDGSKNREQLVRPNKAVEGEKKKRGKHN